MSKVSWLYIQYVSIKECLFKSFEQYLHTVSILCLCFGLVSMLLYSSSASIDITQQDVGSVYFFILSLQ